MAPVPNAARRNVGSLQAPHEEVRALLRVLQRTCIGPHGKGPTRGQIAGLLGISPNTLGAYCIRPRRYGAHRRIPYTTLYALEVLAANPLMVARELWPETRDAAA